MYICICILNSTFPVVNIFHVKATGMQWGHLPLDLDELLTVYDVGEHYSLQNFVWGGHYSLVNSVSN